MKNDCFREIYIGTTWFTIHKFLFEWFVWVDVWFVWVWGLNCIHFVSNLNYIPKSPIIHYKTLIFFPSFITMQMQFVDKLAEATIRNQNSHKNYAFIWQITRDILGVSLMNKFGGELPTNQIGSITKRQSLGGLHQKFTIYAPHGCETSNNSRSMLFSFIFFFDDW